MVLKGVNRVHNDKIMIKWSWKESIGYTMIKLGQMVLKGVNWIHNDKTGSNGLERSQLQVHNDKIWSNGLERSQLGAQ